MTADAAPPPDLTLHTLDAGAALRADLAAQAQASPAAGPGESPNVAPPDAAGREAAWLLLVTSVERGAQLDARRRPAHFRRARAVWEDAAAALGEEGYAEVGARLARWRAADPTLPFVRRLLWAFEQPEAAGYTHLALAGYAALGRLLPRRDVRYGYVLAQSARALRTLGDIPGAVGRYNASDRLGIVHGDRWLRARSAIGLGSTYNYVGNYPAARAVFERVLKRRTVDPQFTAAAHHGLLLRALAADDHDAALAHGWHLLNAGRAGTMPRVDVWLLMAGLCYKIGRYHAAVSAAEAALRAADRPDDKIVALHTLVDVAAATSDRSLARRYGPALRACVGSSAGPYEDARALLSLAGLEAAVDDISAAETTLARVRAIAVRYRYHELRFRAETIEERLRRSDAHGLAQQIPDEQAGGVPLSEQSLRIVQSLAEAEHCDAEAAVAS